MAKTFTLDKNLSKPLNQQRRNRHVAQPKPETILNIMRYSLALEVIRTKGIGAHFLLLN